MILADNEEQAKIGACEYVGSDLGIECLKSKVTDNEGYDYVA